VNHFYAGFNILAKTPDRFFSIFDLTNYFPFPIEVCYISRVYCTIFEFR